MNRDKIRSGCPIVREEELQLCEIVHIGGTHQAVPFPAKVMYLRESEAQILYVHGGKLVKEGPTYNDFYGYLTCLDGAIEEAERLSNAYSVNRESTLEIMVYLTITDKPVTRTEPPKIEYGRTEYFSINRNWLRYVPEQIEAMLKEQDHDNRYEIKKPLMFSYDEEKVFQATVWNSKNPDWLPDAKAWVREQGF